MSFELPTFNSSEAPPLLKAVSDFDISQAAHNTAALHYYYAPVPANADQLKVKATKTVDSARAVYAAILEEPGHDSKRAAAYFLVSEDIKRASFYRALTRSILFTDTAMYLQDFQDWIIAEPADDAYDRTALVDCLVSTTVSLVNNHTRTIAEQIDSEIAEFEVFGS